MLITELRETKMTFEQIGEKVGRPCSTVKNYCRPREMEPNYLTGAKIINLGLERLSDVALLRCGIITKAMKDQRAEALDEMARIDSELELR